MKVNYGPPGHKGVTQIMGLGESEAAILPAAVPSTVEAFLPDKTHRTVAGLALGVGLLGLFVGSQRLQTLSLGGGVAILLCAHLMKQEATEAAAELPIVEDFAAPTGAYPNMLLDLTQGA